MATATPARRRARQGSELSGLPAQFADWFAARGWAPHRHQLDMLEAAQQGESALLIAPTGGGKTLAGFLPSLIELAGQEGEFAEGLHTLYISPLKALAVDIQRNLEQPIAEMALPLRAETRTGDTPQSKRQRQRRQPPHLLMTTPESLALLLSYEDAPEIFGSLRCVIVDELHALEDNKRGDLLSLGLSRLSTLAPQCRRVGLSATVAEPDRLARWLSPDGKGGGVRRVTGDPGAAPDIKILETQARLPWSGHMGVHAVKEVYDLLRDAGTAIVFVNTRAQTEIVFQELWRINDDNLRIALHHGSLAVEQRRKVEAAMARGELDAVVATSSLDLGVDWAAVDLVIQVGAPKGSTRLLQRIGRANHQLDQPSRAVLVPANRFEMLECRAALDAVTEGTLDGVAETPGGLDVLAQHLLGIACSAPVDPAALYREVHKAGPYAGLSRRDFDDVFDFVATGGYALGNYEKYRRLRQTPDGLYGIASPTVARDYRMNVGTIVEAPTLKVRMGRGRVLGEVEEHFVNYMTAGDTFAFAGRLLEFIEVRETDVITRPGRGDAPAVPAYMGGRLPLSTHLADRVRATLAEPSRWRSFSGQVREWLDAQLWRSVMPSAEGLLVETFPRGNKQYLVAYCFEGRNAHQTLGMLLTRRMERLGLKPLGFVATDYVLAIWSLETATDMDGLFAEDMLGDDLEAWMAESSMLKRTFRNVAVIAGLIQRRHPGEEKSRRQVTFNSDLIYDVLRSHEPNHILLRATRADAASGLTDIRRLADMLSRVRGRITHRELDRVSPLAVPVLLEIGRESVYGAAIDELLGENAEELVAEAMTGSDVKELPLT
ncbi:MAG: ligase-associated DNA damage response DEXH box helicase [Alphaproteobacteria bacterium]|nr:ligase-associated DNA damage response DEXH box helicase [Alphaproteobacteria bacterium]